MKMNYKKRIKRILIALLIVAVTVGFIPPVAAPAYADDGTPAIQLVTYSTAANIQGAQASSVWFGNYMQSSADTKEPVKWRVLQNADGKLFLLSDQNLDVMKYNESYTGITWENCTMRPWLNGEKNYEDTYGKGGFLYNAFSDGEQSAISKTMVVNRDNSLGGNDTTDKVFLLSIGEATNEDYGFTNDSSRVATNTQYVAKGGRINSGNMNGVGVADYWWLRSPGFHGYRAAVVYNDGTVYNDGHFVDYGDIAVRPAFNLNLESVLFASAAAGGKSSGAEGALNEVRTTSGSEWKLTLKDGSRSGFTATADTLTNGTLKINYSNATTGTNEYISAVVKNSSDEITCYGRIKKCATSDDASGDVMIKTANIGEGDTLYIFNEQFNGDNKTDYSSKLKEITVPKPVKYTVTFVDGQGKTLKTEQVEDGKAATAPADPKRSGYTFTCWDKDFSNVTEDMTVTAQWKKNADPTPAPDKKVSGTLLAKMTAKGSKSLVLSWNQIKGAEGYDVFFIKCGKQDPKKVKTIKGNKTFKWTKKSLKKKTAYKAYVKAYVMKNGKKTYVKTSPMVHAYTSGSTKNYTNSKSVTVKKTSVSLKAGKTYKIKASVKKLKKSKKLMPAGHAPKLRYLSSNTKVATVSSSGKITAKAKGSCNVYVYAVNGAYKAVKVTVK